jgi:integrase
MQVFKNSSQPLTIAQWVQAFRLDYFSRRSQTPESLHTWKIDYQRVFDRLPQDQELTAELLLAAVASTSPDTRTRKRLCTTFGAIVRFAGLELDLRPYRGKYKPKFRDLPDDKLIRDCFERIQNPKWQWAYGMLAAYGLRPHELFHLDYRRLTAGDVGLKVLRGKTGPRLVFPLFPEWFDEFKLASVQLPNCCASNNPDLGHRVTKAFSRLEIPFPAYSLRHCWAIRSIDFGLDLSIAAQQMGHSVAVHTNQYHAWISERQHRKAFEKLMQNPARPKAPM